MWIRRALTHCACLIKNEIVVKEHDAQNMNIDMQQVQVDQFFLIPPFAHTRVHAKGRVRDALGIRCSDIHPNLGIRKGKVHCGLALEGKLG